MLALAALPAHGLSQVKKVGGNAYLFRMKFVPGKTYRYGIESKVASGSQIKPFTITGPMTLKVVAVSGDTARINADLGPLSSNGQVVKPTTSVTFKEDTRGKVTGGTGGVQQIGVVLPSEPKKIGQTWDAQTAMMSASGTPTTVKAHYRLIGMSTVAGHKAAKLGVSFKMSEPTPSTGHGTIFLLADDCSLWSTNVGVQLSFGGTNMHLTMGMTRH